MPLTHVLLDGDRYTLDEAREVVASRDYDLRYTPELLDSILETRQERDYISTTTLTGKCLRQKALEQQYNYTEDIDAMWAAFRGTMFHGQLEQHVGADAVEEARFFVTLPDGNVLSGSPDLIIPSQGIEYDYKFCKEVPRWDKPWPDHVQQLNVNRWLVDHADRVQWRGWTFFAEDTDLDPEPIQGQEHRDYPADVQYAEDFRPRDWQDLIVVYMDDKGTKPLRIYKSIDVPKANGEGTKKARVPDIWSDEQAEEFILRRYAEAHDALTLGNIPPAPEGWEHQSHILCQYCPVRAECAALEFEAAVAAQKEAA